MSVVVLDTNVIIRHVAGFEPIALPAFTAAVSTITVFELLRFPGMSEIEQSAVEAALSVCLQFPVSALIGRRAALLSKTRPKMKALDLLIAATALELQAPLITQNVRDFKGIPDLKVRTKV